MSMEREDKRDSLSLIDGFKTSFEKNKIPYKKLNHKSLMYKKRIGYGRLETCGILNGELRLMPELSLEGENFFAGRVKIPCASEKDPNQEPINGNFVNRMLSRNEEYLFLTPSRREINLKKLLEIKLKNLLELCKNK